MAHITADRVKENTTTTGTGAITLAGAFVGYRTFSSVLAIGDTCYYSIAALPGSEWEVGIGTYSALNTLTRTTVLSSSIGGTAVTFSAGPKEIFITAAASRFLQSDASNNYNSFSAGTITAALTGNASTATTLETARNINGVSFNGSADITLNADSTVLSIDGAVSITAVAGQHIVCTNVATVTITLPAVPVAGQIVVITPGNGLTTNVIARNGNNIMSLAENMIIDNENVTVTLRYINSTIGWRII